MAWVNALFVEIAVVLVAAPLAGVALAPRRLAKPGTAAARAWRALWPLVAGAALVTIGSAVAFAILTSGVGAARIAASHVVLWTAAIALSAIGSWCATQFMDPLDAAGCALAATMTPALGVLVAGPMAIQAPTGVINASLVASPVVAIASAADIDLFRTPLLYHLSPLAHTRFDYPSWSAAAAVYVAVALLCSAAIAFRCRPGPAGPGIPSTRSHVVAGGFVS